MPISPTSPTAPPAAPAVQTPAPTPVAMQEPAAGGNYVRDPITGAITPNPQFQEVQE